MSTPTARTKLARLTGALAVTLSLGAGALSVAASPAGAASAPGTLYQSYATPFGRAFQVLGTQITGWTLATPNATVVRDIRVGVAAGTKFVHELAAHRWPAAVSHQIVVLRQAVITVDRDLSQIHSTTMMTTNTWSKKFMHDLTVMGHQGALVHVMISK